MGSNPSWPAISGDKMIKPKDVKQFLREVKVELKKVTWPSRKETISATSVVLIVTFIAAFYLGLVDIILTKLVKLFLSL